MEIHGPESKSNVKIEGGIPLCLFSAASAINRTCFALRRLHFPDPDLPVNSDALGVSYFNTP
jgi:hypothetical protein